MRIIILTLFPPMFESPFAYSIVARARKEKQVTIEYINIRDFTLDKYQTVDGKPYGGGTGMVMRVDVIDRALVHIKDKLPKTAKVLTVLMDASGAVFTQQKARTFATYDSIILICGHYEGVDARVYDLVDQRLSIGAYILTGGELPAMVVVDAVTRLLPGVLAKEDATTNESFKTSGYHEHPQYTRPQTYKGKSVPDVLTQGDHQKIEEWKEKNATTD